jgi:hypothetical protein
MTITTARQMTKLDCKLTVLSKTRLNAVEGRFRTLVDVHGESKTALDQVHRVHRQSRRQ